MKAIAILATQGRRLWIISPVLPGISNRSHHVESRMAQALMLLSILGDST